MAFRWSVLCTGRETGRSQDFPTRADAEDWLREGYEDLVDEGADAVTLLEDDHVVYGPMSLLA